MEVRLVTPDAGAQPGELSQADGSGPPELLAYRSAQGRWVVAAMIAGSSVAGIDSTVVAVALPAIGRNLHAGFGALQWTVTSYTLTLASRAEIASVPGHVDQAARSPPGRRAVTQPRLRGRIRSGHPGTA